MIGIYDVDRIYSENGTMQIVRSINNRNAQCSFQTRDFVEEWDEIVIETDYDVVIFAGILDSPDIDFAENATAYQVNSDGWRKLFDRDKVADSWDDTLSGDIVRDILADFCPGFSNAGVEDGIILDAVLFNYSSPTECIDRIAKATGYTWYIDANKVVHFVADNSEDAEEGIDDDSNFQKDLNINIDISNLVNVVVVRGGTYLSEEVIYTEVADGQKTKFVLPEKPHDVSVYVNSSLKTLGIKFGELAPTAQFQLNFNEKYIENGTNATLANGNVFEVRYKYDVPIRVRSKNAESIAAMRILFPETNGEFTKVIQDSTIASRDLAYEIARQNLDKYATRIISGSFKTVEDMYKPGQVIPIAKGDFTGSALIQKIKSRHIAGSLWNHTINFATVLFGFEEFMRELYTSRKIALVDGESLETLHDQDDEILVTDTVIAGVDTHRQTDDVGVDDSANSETNFGEQYVYGPYFPSSFSDPKRVFILDGSPLA